MGVYRFEFVDENSSSMEKDFIMKPISRFKLCKDVGCTFILGLIIFLVQYRVFYENRTSKDFPEVCYKIIMAIYLISAGVNMSFSVRIFKINKTFKEKGDLVTALSVTAVFLVFNTYLTMCAPKSSEFDNYSYLLKTIYACVFTPSLLFFQMTSFLCQVFVAKYVIECRLAKTDEEYIKFYKLVVRAEADAGLVSVLDCFLRAAPQLILQLSFVLRDHGPWTITHIPDLQLLSALIAIFMMPWSITSFQGCLRMQQNYELAWTTKIIYFSWHFFIMLSRIGSIAAAAAFWPEAVEITILIHCVSATIWLIWKTEPMKFCNYNKFWHFLFCCVFGCVYLFYPINLVKGPTFWKNVCFYVIMYVQNMVAICFWFRQEHEMQQIWKFCFFVANVIMFCGGICFMLVYYSKFHPKSRCPLNNMILENPANDDTLNDHDIELTEIRIHG